VNAFLDMGAYAPYVWSSYVIVIVVISYMGISSFRRLTRLQKDLYRIKGARSKEDGSSQNLET